MAARLTITVDDAEVSAALAAAAARLDDLTGLMDQIGKSLVTSTRARFERQAGPDGVPWARSRRAAEQGGQTLVNRGLLRDLITHRPARDSVEVGTSVPYAAVHQFGATITAKTGRGLRFKIGEAWVTVKSVTIPARPYLGLDGDDRTEILALAADWMRPGPGPGPGPGPEAA
jgi:phage virion morphogenesis protein